MSANRGGSTVVRVPNDCLHLVRLLVDNRRFVFDCVEAGIHLSLPCFDKRVIRTIQTEGKAHRRLLSEMARFHLDMAEQFKKLPRYERRKLLKMNKGSVGDCLKALILAKDSRIDLSGYSPSR